MSALLRRITRAKNRIKMRDWPASDRVGYPARSLKKKADDAITYGASRAKDFDFATIVTNLLSDCLRAATFRPRRCRSVTATDSAQ